MRKAKENMERMKKAKKPENIEYWEVKKEGMETMRDNMISKLTECKFLIECYEEKIKTFKQ